MSQLFKFDVLDLGLWKFELSLDELEKVEKITGLKGKEAVDELGTALLEEFVEPMESTNS